MELVSCAIESSDMCLVLGLCVEKNWAYNCEKQCHVCHRTVQGQAKDGCAVQCTVPG